LHREAHGIDKGGSEQAFVVAVGATSGVAPAMATSASQSKTPANTAAGQRQTCHHRRTDPTSRSATSTPPLDAMRSRRLLPSPKFTVSSPHFCGGACALPQHHDAILPASMPLS